MKFSLKKINPWTYVLIITVISFFLRTFPFDTSYFFWDETIYLMNAEFFVHGSAPYTEIITRPPFLPFLLTPFIAFMENIEVFSRLIMAFLNSLLIPVVYLLGKEINKKTAFLSSVFVALFPFHIMASGWVMTDALSALFISLTVLLFWKGLKYSKSGFVYSAGFILGLSILTKFTNLILFILILPLLIYFRKNNLKNIAISFLVFFITLTPFLIFNYKLFGSMFYIFQRAFHVVKTSEPVSFLFTLISIYDFFGVILLGFFFFGIYRISKEKQRINIKHYFVFWALFSIIYYIFLLQRGVAKPPSIGWEVERFLFPSLVPIIITASYTIQKILKKKHVYVVVIIFVVLGTLGYQRAYTPSIDHELGLRTVTKELGLFIKDNTPEDAVIHCTQNCPVLAYYSRRSIEITNLGNIGNFTYLAKIEKTKQLNPSFVKETYHKEWYAYLYKNME